LKLKYDKVLSSFALKFNLRRYNAVHYLKIPAPLAIIAGGVVGVICWAAGRGLHSSTSQLNQSRF
jgi:hypothetical protein